MSAHGLGARVPLRPLRVLTAALVAGAAGLGFTGIRPAGADAAAAGSSAALEASAVAAASRGGFAQLPLVGWSATLAQRAALGAVPGRVKGTYAVTGSVVAADAAYSVEIRADAGGFTRVYLDVDFRVVGAKRVLGGPVVLSSTATRPDAQGALRPSGARPQPARVD